MQQTLPTASMGQMLAICGGESCFWLSLSVRLVSKACWVSPIGQASSRALYVHFLNRLNVTLRFCLHPYLSIAEYAVLRRLIRQVGRQCYYSLA